MGNNNEQKIKEAVSECNGKLQGREHDLKSILYCPIIPISAGKGLCEHQSEDLIYIAKYKIKEKLEISENKYYIPRYLCLWKNENKNE